MSMSSVGSSSKRRVHGIPSIPAASKKMVDSLKEIVSCPEHEIYAMLKECNMDPNDTVNRLLSQDPFREVKSKREKKKETKDSSESRSRGVGSSSSRGGKSSSQRNVGRSGPTQFSSSDSGGLRGRPAYKTENGGATLPSSVSSGSSTIRNYISYSDFVPSGHAGQTLNTNDDMPLPSQPSSGYQPAWVGVPGQVSMADIVRRGRPQGKPPSMNTVHRSVEKPPSFTPLPTDFQHDLNSSQHPASEILDITQESGIPVTGSSVVNPSFDSVAYADPSTSSNLHSKADLSVSLLLDEVRMPERNASVENQIAVSSLERQIQVDDSHHSQGLGSDLEEGIGENSNLSISDYPASSSDEDDGVAVSSAAVNLQQLTLQKEELDTPRSTTGVDNLVVIIPNHLQLSTTDYSHLSFGSFGSNMNASFSGPFGPKTLKNNLEESSVAADPSSLKHADPQSNEFYGNDQLRSASHENVNVLSSSQPEATKHDNPTEPTHGHQYALSSAAPGYGFGTNTQANVAAYSYAQTNSQTQNLAPFSSVMQSHINPLPNSLLAPTAQSGRESDLSYSPFQATQSMSTKYNTAAMSSISGPTMPMPEGMIQGVVSSPQPTLQTLPNTSIPTGQALPQHLPVHPYSQPTLPLGHFANMISYPFLPPSYTYLPYATGGSNSFHQYPAAMHSAAGIRYSIPQYKNSASVSNLPQSATIPSGYGGGYGNSTNIPVNLNLSSSTLASTSIGYEDVIASMKDSNHYSLIQQNEGSPMWFHGPNSRTMPSLPANTYYSFQGQNQPGGFHQGQQQSLYGALGYPNVYQSQAGVSLEHQQTPGDANLSTSQGPPSQQSHSHQIWQHGY